MKDITGREYAKFDEVKPGDQLEPDGEFDCMREGEKRVVKSDKDGLYIECDDTIHYLIGQLEDGYLIGLYKV